MFDVLITWLKINETTIQTYESINESLCFWPITAGDFDIKSRTMFSLTYLEYAHDILEDDEYDEDEFQIGDTASLLLTYDDSYVVECKCHSVHPLSFEILKVTPVIEHIDDKTPV